MAKTADIEREIETLAESARGVSYDGEHVWVATGKQLVACDADSGKRARTLDVAAEAGTAFDGKHLYQIGQGAIQKLDPHSGQVLARIPLPSESDNSGLAWAEGSLWVGQMRGRKIVRIDPESGRVLAEIDSNRFVTGVSFCEGELWHATLENEQSELRHVDRRSGAVLDSVTMPAGTAIHGLESNGKDRFFCGGGKGGKVRVVKRPRGAK
ncbi:MAG: glutamine cyclotransferase [Polyangiaceae bacterium]